MLQQPKPTRERNEKMSYELYIPPKWTGRNAKTGRFLKGHTPYNKGKKWSEYLSKRVQKRMAKGWKNLEKYRVHPANAGRCRKKVIAVDDNGKWRVFDSITAAAKWAGGPFANVRRCCNENLLGTKDKKGKVNDDHRFYGLRWYYETDDKWTTKIKNT